MATKHEMTIRMGIDTETFRVQHDEAKGSPTPGYPWYKLEREGDVLLLKGEYPRRSATLMAYQFAKRHGFRVSVLVKRDHLRVIRRADRGFKDSMDHGLPEPGQFAMKYPYVHLAVKGSCLIEWESRDHDDQQRQGQRIVHALGMYMKRSGKGYRHQFKGKGLEVYRWK